MSEDRNPEGSGRRKERRGMVVSDAMDKTVVVRVDVDQAASQVREDDAPLDPAACARRANQAEDR